MQLRQITGAMSVVKNLNNILSICCDKNSIRSIDTSSERLVLSGGTTPIVRSVVPAGRSVWAALSLISYYPSGFQVMTQFKKFSPPVPLGCHR